MPIETATDARPAATSPAAISPAAKPAAANPAAANPAAAVPAPGPDLRTRVLDAAEAIVQARGVAGLTLEAAARDAGVSKGGLLYHFASKEALLTAMLARLAAFIGREYQACVDAQPPGPARHSRATLDWGFGTGAEGEGLACDARHDRAAAVFLAAHHHDPALLDPMRQVIARMRANFPADGLPPGHAEAIYAAADGMFMARLFRLYAPTPAEMAAMRAALARLLEAAS